MALQRGLSVERRHTLLLKMLKTLSLIIAWLGQLLLVGAASSSPPRRLRSIASKVSSIPLPSSPFLRNSYQMNNRRYLVKGKHHERQLQNKTNKRKEQKRRSSSHKKQRGFGSWKHRRLGKKHGQEKKKEVTNKFKRIVAW